MKKNINFLFHELQKSELNSKSTSKIVTPIYTPNNRKPNILELVNDKKANKIILDIINSGVTEREKQFLIKAASRHFVFNYQKIADYYSHANKEMQLLMEKQLLVIIDFERAYELGYVKLADDIANCYLDNYGE